MNTPTTTQDALTTDELNALVAQFRSLRPTPCRNKALILAMADAGLRLAEALALELRDLRTDAGEITHIDIRKGKGARPRRVGTTPRLQIALLRWLEVRRGLAIPGPILFCSISGGRSGGLAPGQPLEPGRALSPRYAQQLVQREARRADIPRRVTPHTLRHTFATRLLRSCGNLETVRKAMGHRSITTTSAYYSHLVQDDVDQAVAGLGLEDGKE